MAKKWMQKVKAEMERKGTTGALREQAKRRGLIKDDEPLSASDLDRLEAEARREGDTKLLRRVNLARVFKREHRAEKGAAVYGGGRSAGLDAIKKSIRRRHLPAAEEGAVVFPYLPGEASPLPSEYHGRQPYDLFTDALGGK